jgi:hypothetical protein
VGAHDEHEEVTTLDFVEDDLPPLLTASQFLVEPDLVVAGSELVVQLRYTILILARIAEENPKGSSSLVAYHVTHSQHTRGLAQPYTR